MAYPPKRRQIIKAAYNLFKANGFYATSMDEVLEKAKVSKRTLYKHFPSKNDLVVEALRYYKEDYEKGLRKPFRERKVKTAHCKLKALFEHSLIWFRDKMFHGCLAIHAIGEFSDKDKAIMQACLDFKEWQHNMIEDLVHEAGFEDPEHLACELFVIMEGLTVIAERSTVHCPVDPISFLEKVLAPHKPK